MQVDVYDTYATDREGSTLHFDVLVPSGTTPDVAFGFAQQWLSGVGQGDADLKQERCSFCHSENALPAVVADIQKDGFHILQMEGCPNPS